jgi:nucleoside-diphosphate-sugar epimerase
VRIWKWNGQKTEKKKTTYADATALERDFGFTPKITLGEGLRKFAEWYKYFTTNLL